MRESDETTIVARLEADALLRREGSRWRTAKRFQAAMARAALRLRAAGEDGDDLRVPIAHALLELYPGEPDEVVFGMLEVVLPIELAELSPRLATQP